MSVTWFVCQTNAESIQELSTFTRQRALSYLLKALPAISAQCIIAFPIGPASRALEVMVTRAPIDAKFIVEVRPNGRRRDMALIKWAEVIGTLQPHTGKCSLFFLELECFLQSDLQRAGVVGGRTRRDVFNLFSHESDRLRLFQIRDQKVPPHLLTEQKRELSVINFTA